MCFTGYNNLLIKKLLLAIHHKVSSRLYISNHINSILVWINFMPPFLLFGETDFTLY
jgi:hypothetical protein